ncbi:hypothetical protein KQI52_08265 [bacterium]|nr:hypothetical protein [bacterium]
MAEIREIKETFVAELKSGFLAPIMEFVRKDDGLDLQVRHNYVNIYYRGGNLLRIRDTKLGYKLEFDVNYFKNETHGEWYVVEVPETSIITDIQESQEWARNLPLLKQEMDFWFSEHPKTEREIQQLIVRENNYSGVARDTDYYICDIEYSALRNKTRVDLIGVEWISTAGARRSGNNKRLCLMEFKFGDGALTGNAGMIDHLRKMKELVETKDAMQQLRDSAQVSFNIKQQLGLIPSIKHEITISDEKPLLLFVIANHKPVSKALGAEVNALQEEAGDLVVRFAVAHYLGYGLYNDSILTLDEFLNLQGVAG